MAFDPKNNTEDRAKLERMMVSVQGHLNVEGIMESSREDMLAACFNQLVELTSLMGSSFHTLYTSCPFCVDNNGERQTTCPLCVAISLILMTDKRITLAVTAAMAKWNALHPDQKPIGSKENLAVVEEALKASGN